MWVADSYVGHRGDPDVADRLEDGDPTTVILSDTDRQRSRVRTETEDGRDLGIVVARDLADGDVLEADGELVVIELAAIDALVLDIGDVPATDALELGHALGNRHWELAMRDDEALFPVPDTRERMRAAVADDLPDGVEIGFEQVSPTLFDDGERTEHGYGEHGHTGDEHSHDGHTHDAHSHDHDGQSHGADGGVRTITGGEK